MVKIMQPQILSHVGLGLWFDVQLLALLLRDYVICLQLFIFFLPQTII